MPALVFIEFISIFLIQFQKAVMHSLVASVHNSRCRISHCTNGVVDIGDSITVFNDSPGSMSSAALQSHLLHLVLAIVQLEHTLAASRMDSNVQVQLSIVDFINAYFCFNKQIQLMNP